MALTNINRLIVVFQGLKAVVCRRTSNAEAVLFAYTYLGIMITPYRKILFVLVLIALLLTGASPVWGLMTGLLFCLTLGSPFSGATLGTFHKPLLKAAVVGLGFGLSIDSVVSTGREGLWVTLVALSAVLVTGLILGKLLKINMRTAFLISSGTAICGGSAIAALSPVVNAKNKEISAALGVVFVLNAVALVAFPWVGRWLDLTSTQFAWWAAMAIHDTSSVVGATAAFSPDSLALATTLKLTRALWILPISLILAVGLGTKRGATIPYFILYFLLAAVIASYLPIPPAVSSFIVSTSRSMFTLVLFMIGVGLEKTALREVGIRPVIYGIVLWVATAVFSLLFVYQCCQLAQL